MSFDQFVQAVRGSSIDLPGGLIKAEGGEIALRTKEQDYVGGDFRDIVLLTNPDGGKLTLGAIATVKDGFADQDMATLFNGKPAAIVLVKEVGDENPLDISEMVYDYVEEAMETWVPEGVALEAWSDSSFYLQGRIDMLLDNGLIGFVLVLIALAIFLRPTWRFLSPSEFRLAFWPPSLFPQPLESPLTFCLSSPLFWCLGSLLMMRLSLVRASLPSFRRAVRE